MVYSDLLEVTLTWFLTKPIPSKVDIDAQEKFGNTLRPIEGAEQPVAASLCNGK